VQENIPLTVERLSDTQQKDFCVTSALQIQSLLRGLMEKGLPAALYFDGAENFIMTSVLDVGNKGFWVEQGVDEPKNRRIAKSHKIILVSALDQVKIQFSGNEARAATHQSYPAFYLPFTGNLYRLQQREYYRLMLPHSRPLTCLVPVIEPPAQRLVEISVMDISIGGVRLFYTDNDIEFTAGQIYAGCQIDLPELGKINVTIIVKKMVSISPKLGQIIRRIGCEFKDSDNTTGILLQRYITKMQRIKVGQ